MDGADERVLEQSARHEERVVHVALHAHVQCLEAAPQQVAVERRGHCSDRCSDEHRHDSGQQQQIVLVRPQKECDQKQKQKQEYPSG